MEDALTEVLRQGSRQLLLQAVQAELEEFLSRYSELRDADGRRQVVRNGYLPEREVQTGIGAVQVKVPRVGTAAVRESASPRPSCRHTRGGAEAWRS